MNWQLYKWLFILILFTPHFVCGQVPQNNDINLKGKVLSVRQAKFAAIQHPDTVVKGDTINCSGWKYLFDTKKRLIKEVYCASNKWITCEYIYDNENKLLEKTDIEELVTRYEYDEMGHIVRELLFDSEGLFGYWKYGYDKKGNRIERIGYLGNDFVERWIMNYNKENELVKEFNVDEESDNKPKYMLKVFEYDKKGRLIVFSTTDLDSKGKAIERFSYNDKNDIIEHYIKNDFQGGLEDIRHYTYIYDKKGNWTQQTEYHNKKPISITERIIEYQ